jgi:hypothetical protein
VTNALYGPPTSVNEYQIPVRNSTNATLSNLESALERATAMTIWSAARAGTVTMVSVSPAAGGGNFLLPVALPTQLGETVVTQRIPKSRLLVRRFLELDLHALY